MRRYRSQTDRTPKWKFINVIDGDDVQIFELNDHEKLVKKFPKMKPRKLCQEIPKLKSYPAPYQMPLQNTIMQVQGFMPPLFFTIPPQATNSNTEIRKENIVRSNCAPEHDIETEQIESVFDDHLINDLNDQNNFDFITDDNFFGFPLSNDASDDFFALNAL